MIAICDLASKGELVVHIQARRLRERFCAKICPEADGDVYWISLCGFEVGFVLAPFGGDRATVQHKQYVHNKTCRGGVVEQLKCIRSNTFSDSFGQSNP